MLRQIKSVVSCQLSVVRKGIFLCILSAVLLILSFPKFNLEFLAWFGFVPLFLALKNKNKFKAFLFSYLTGVIFWLGTIYWLIHVTLLGLIILVLYLALYFAIFGLVLSSIQHLASSIQLFFIPSAWVLLEYLRAHLLTGFPWALLGYSQYLNLPVIQIADITGAWGVSFLVMMVNVTVYSVIGYRLSVIGGKQKFLLPILCILVTLTYGYYKIYLTPNTAHRKPIKVSVIQGNIPQELKWDPQAKDFIIDKYIAISREALKDKPDLIIWPEAAMPVVLEEEPLYYEKVSSLAKQSHTPLLLGAVTLRDSLYYNSAILVSPEGKLLERYDKLHLVPFGEYIPLRSTLGFLETIVPIGDFARGKEYTTFKLQAPSSKLQARFSVLICFEDLFPELSREFSKRGADFLVNITNDAWFKKTSSPYQHLQASVFRAVENRVFLIRSANTGVSGFIAPNGKIISLVKDQKGRNIFISGYNTQGTAPFKENISFYTRHGDIFIWACILLVLYGIIKIRRQRQNAKP